MWNLPAFRRNVQSAYVKVKQSDYRPGQALRVPGVCVSRFEDNRHIKMVGLSALKSSWLYPPKLFLVFISVRGWVEPMAFVRPEWLCQWKVSMIPAGIETANFRLVEQFLNPLRHLVPHRLYMRYLQSVPGTALLLGNIKQQNHLS